MNTTYTSLETGINWDQILTFAGSRPGIVLAALITAMALPLSANLFCLLFTRLRERVNPGGLHPSTASLYGLIANAVILLPAGALVWSMKNLAPQEQLYDYLLLLFSLEFATVRSCVHEVSFRLRRNDLPQARKAASQLLLRETSKLSSMGTAKAVAESQILHIFQGYYVPVFWYLLLGPEAAFFTALLIIMSHAFSIKLAVNGDFGSLNALLVRLLYLPAAPVMLVFLLLATFDFRAAGRSLDHMRSHPVRLTGLLLGFVGEHLDISLGGPRFYQGQKIRYIRFGGKTEPAPVHLDQIWRMLRNSVLLSALCLIAWQVLHQTLLGGPL